MKSLMWRRLLGAVALVLAAMPMAATGATQPAAPMSWMSGWPMVGHDPQRTMWSALDGPITPRLLWTYKHLSGQAIIGADGSVYGWGSKGLVAISAAGKVRWTVNAQEGFGGPPALGPDGLLRVSGQLPGTSTQSNAQPHVSLFAVSPQGQVVWTIHSLPWATVPNSVPFSKGTPPLITASNLFYVPFVGPSYTRLENNGVEEVSASGTPLQRLFAGYGGPIAMAPDGTVYQLGYDYQGFTAVQASRADGTLLWSHDVTYTQSGSVLVGVQGTVFVSDGTGTGPTSAGEVAAYSPTGQLLWHMTTNGGIPNLGERGDGVIIIADNTGLTAVSPQGTYLWYRVLGQPPITGSASPSLAIDASARIYAGSVDGKVRVVGPNGALLSTWSIGGPSSTNVPTCAIVANRVLVVTGTDSVVRVIH